MQCSTGMPTNGLGLPIASVLAVTLERESTVESSYIAWITRNRVTISEMKRLEEENNRLHRRSRSRANSPRRPHRADYAYGEPAYRYGGNPCTEDEQWARFRQDTMQELISYAIGCMMGRYSLTSPA